MADEDIARYVTEQLAEAGIELAGPGGGTKTRFVRAANLPIEPGTVMFVDVFQAPDIRTFCRGEPLLDLAGYGVTGPDGSARFDLREYACTENLFIDEDQIWVVATPRSREPVYLTHEVGISFDPPGPLPPLAGHVRIFAWDSAGQPKSGAAFTFRALFYASPGVE